MNLSWKICIYTFFLVSVYMTKYKNKAFTLVSSVSHLVLAFDFFSLVKNHPFFSSKVNNFFPYVHTSHDLSIFFRCRIRSGEIFPPAWRND